MSLTLFILPSVDSNSFSGLLAKNLKEKEEKMVKTVLIELLGENGSKVTWEPSVRCLVMKHILALYESPYHKNLTEKKLDVAIKVIGEEARLPSEIYEGLAFMKSCVGKLPLPLQASNGAYLSGKVDKEGSHVMLMINEGGVTIRGTTKKICDHVLGKMNTVNEKMELMF